MKDQIGKFHLIMNFLHRWSLSTDFESDRHEALLAISAIRCTHFEVYNIYQTGGEPRGPEGLSPDLGSGCFLLILFLLFWALENGFLFKQLKSDSYGGFVPSPMSLCEWKGRRFT